MEVRITEGSVNQLLGEGYKAGKVKGNRMAAIALVVHNYMWI